MEDYFEQNSSDLLSLNSSFMKYNESFYPEEKGTIFTTNLFDNENNYYLNGFYKTFKNSYNENENFRDDENNFLKRKTKRDVDIKQENKKDNNRNIFTIEKKIRKSEELKKILNKNLNDYINLKNEESKKAKQYNFGRKKQKSGEKGKHNKNCEDNIVNKIKAYFFNHYRMK